MVQSAAMKLFLVGGAVRDKLLGLPVKDFDFAVEAESFEAMREEFLNRGGVIYLEKPEYQTIRGQIDFQNKRVDADFVLCRKEGFYSDGRRPDSVTIGNLLDDLSRRDFTVNAMAEDEDGNLIDPFNGQKDLDLNVLRCVGNTKERFKEDSLRMLRALRFAISKGFVIGAEINKFLSNPDNAELLRNVSNERIREELAKCFRANTSSTLLFLSHFGAIGKFIFNETGIWLKPSLEKR